MPAIEYSEDKKREAMVLYARGTTDAEIGRKLDIPAATIGRWRKNDDPVPWDTVKASYVKDSLEAALQQIRIQAAKQMADHFDDTVDQRLIVRRVMGLLNLKLSQLYDEHEKHGKVPSSNELKHLVDAMRKTISASRLIQEQQRDALGLPKIKLTSESDGDNAGSNLSPAELDKLAQDDPEKLLQVALARLDGSKDVRDVTPD